MSKQTLRGGGGGGARTSEIRSHQAQATRPVYARGNRSGGGCGVAFPYLVRRSPRQHISEPLLLLLPFSQLLSTCPRHSRHS